MAGGDKTLNNPWGARGETPDVAEKSTLGVVSAEAVTTLAIGDVCDFETASGPPLEAPGTEVILNTWVGSGKYAGVVTQDTIVAGGNGRLRDAGYEPGVALTTGVVAGDPLTPAGDGTLDLAATGDGVVGIAVNDEATGVGPVLLLPPTRVNTDQGAPS